MARIIKPRLVHPTTLNTLRSSAAPLPMHGAASRSTPEDTDDVKASKRARLMLAARANLHFTDEIESGVFVFVDPAEMKHAEAEAAGFVSRTLVLHTDDLDRALKQFEVM